MKRRFPWLLVALVAAVTGCHSSRSNRALLHLPADQRSNLNAVISTNTVPTLRFETAGRFEAEKYLGYGGIVGAFIGAAVLEGTRDHGAARELSARQGHFEVQAFNEQWKLVLQRNGLTNTFESGASSTFHVTLLTVGLQETERSRFAAFGIARAELRDPKGARIWTAYARSSSPRPRLLDDFSKDPQLYRRQFEELSADLSHQLIEGPLRAFSR